MTLSWLIVQALGCFAVGLLLDTSWQLLTRK
jgi:hypothetical protein